MRLYSRSTCALALLVAPGCTLLSDFGIHQCESSSDCDVLDGEIRRCVDSQCLDGCENNHHCNAFDPRAPICPALGAECVSLTSDDRSCYVSSTYDDATMGELLGSELTVIGAFAPTLTSSTWLTLGLATDELNAAAVSGASALAPSLAILCRGGDDAVVSMEHLVGPLQASGIVASLEAVPLDAIQQRPAPSPRALLLSPYSADMTATGGDPWTWYLGGRYQDAAALYPALIRQLQGSIEQGLAAGRGLRIASLVSEAREDVQLAEAVEGALELDGRTTDYLFREDRFRRFPLSDDSPEDRALVPAAIAAYAPDLILVFLGGEFDVPRGEPRLSLLGELEGQVGEGGAWSPFYLLGPRALGDDATALLASENERFRTNAVGVSVERVPEASRREGLFTRYDAAFPASASTGLYPAMNTYDAVYHLAYAAAVARTREPAITAASVLDGLARLTNPQEDCVEVGPEGIAAATERIQKGEPFQLCGTTGPARFSPDHARSGQSEIFCWTAAGAAATIEVSATLPSGDAPAVAECAPLLVNAGAAP